ncbi:hypothetical protein OSB04_019324 [Centaurea solstitialis]|uniref:Integrase catalytic domain-containing protein n=1 Tax=Centaurea solstitialis TaxID=347529 RepID=A0AA38T3I9_9ASTR|nr:hypothetical protein OSB04_019324 [Centaurea solstitialis]
MEANRPPDPPVTRNRAKKNKQKKGLASPTLPLSSPATTAAVPACGGVDCNRPSLGSPTVVVGCQTNTSAAAAFSPATTTGIPASGGDGDVWFDVPIGVVTSISGINAAAVPASTTPVAFATVVSPAVGVVGSQPVRSPVGLLNQQPPCGFTPPMVSATKADDGVDGGGSLDERLKSSQVVSSPAKVVSVGGSTTVTPTIVDDTSTKPTVEGGGYQNPNLETSGNFVDKDDNVHIHVDANEKISLKPVSFADLLKKSANLIRGKGKLIYYPPAVYELGTRHAAIPDELIQKQGSKWALTLAGYFLGKRPAFPFVQFHARRMWKQFGLSEVILNDQGYFFFKFNSEQGLNFVLENGPWLFNGMPIFIQQWQPGLCFDKPEPKKVPLWVNIFGLPLDVWDFEIISYIASVVGEPISVDRYTEEMCETKAGRANFARVLVNASADYELPTEVDAIILGKLRKFRTEFLWKPKSCSLCKLFGHDLTSCLFRPRTVEELNKDKPVPSSVGEPSKAKVIDDGFIFPKRKNKHKPKIAPLKVGGQKPKVAFNTGVKINQRFVPNTDILSIDTIDKGKAMIGDDKPPPKVVKTERMTTRVDDNTNSKVQNLNTERIPIKVSNQFTVLEEHPKWTADKKEVDCYVEKRGVGLEPVIINSWSRQKLDYFIDRWERVFGKEPDGKLRGFTLPERIEVGDDDDDDTSDDDVLSDHDTVMDTRPKKVSWSDRQAKTFRSCYHKVSFSKKDCKVKNRHKKVILRGQRFRDVYTINMDTSTENVCFMSRASSNINWLWHKRLSHLNFKTINQLSISNLVDVLPEKSFAKESLCSACEKGKQTRASFKSMQVSTISSPLQLLHMDLFGPVNTQSIGGKLYTLVIVDEYSRYTWVFFLRSKSDASQEIINFILQMEKYNQITVRSLRSDHGTEFKNSVLDDFLVSKGISQNFSSVRTPQQNGVAERRNRTLIEAARSILIEARLPLQFWAEAVNTACYTQNRSLIVKRFKKTAYELFRGRKPNISYFHIFGCNCYIKNDRDNLRKFDAKADDGFLVGYSTVSKAYCVFNKRRQTLEETIHVKFDEIDPFSSVPSFTDSDDIDQWANSYFQVPENDTPKVSTPVAGSSSYIPDGFEEPNIPQDTPIHSAIPLNQVSPTISQEDIPSTSGSTEVVQDADNPLQLNDVPEASILSAAEPIQILTGVTLKCLITLDVRSLPPCYGVAVERTKYPAVLMISNQIPQSPETGAVQGHLYPDESSGCHKKLSSLLSLSSVFRSRACCSCHQLILRRR